MRIGELSSRSGVSVRPLRYYEQQELLHPQRTRSGQRVYTAMHHALVIEIQELFQAGFCSSVIRELLPALGAATTDEQYLKAMFDAAAARLESEKKSIEDELSALSRLRDRKGLASDTRVSMHAVNYDSSSTAPPASFDHRNRRLR